MGLWLLQVLLESRQARKPPGPSLGPRRELLQSLPGRGPRPPPPVLTGAGERAAVCAWGVGRGAGAVPALAPASL